MNMKKIFAIFLLVIMCTALFACVADKGGQSGSGTSSQTTDESASKKLSEMGEMNFTLASDKDGDVTPYKYYYGGQLYGSDDEMTYFGTGKILGFDIKTCIDLIPEMTVKNGFAVKTDKNVDVFDTVGVFDTNGEKIYSGDASLENIRAVSDGKNCIVQLTAKRSGEGRYSDEYSMYLIFVKVRFE